MSYNPLSLDMQLCFPLYASARKIIGLYKPFLDAIGLTYTQYLVMLVLWEAEETTVKHLGERLYLDSGTLTPLLKKMEKQGLVTRRRDPQDERSVRITLTQNGAALRQQALSIPESLRSCVSIPQEDAIRLHQLLHDFLATTPTTSKEDFCP